MKYNLMVSYIYITNNSFSGWIYRRESVLMMLECWNTHISISPKRLLFVALPFVHSFILRWYNIYHDQQKFIQHLFFPLPPFRSPTSAGKMQSHKHHIIIFLCEWWLGTVWLEGNFPSTLFLALFHIYSQATLCPVTVYYAHHICITHCVYAFISLGVSSCTLGWRASERAESESRARREKRILEYTTTGIRNTANENSTHN